MDPNGIHHKNVVVHFLSAQNFVMDFPIHFQREIHRKKKSISIHKMPAILSQEICDGFADTFARSIAKMSKKRWLVVFSQQKKCDEFSNTCPKKKPLQNFQRSITRMSPKNFVMDPNGIHHKNVALSFLLAKNFVMDCPMHVQGKIHRTFLKIHSQNVCRPQPRIL